MASQAEKQFSIGRPIRINKALRDQLEDAIQAHLAAAEKLVAVLDRADGDPDLEPSISQPVPAYNSVALVDAEGDEHDGRELTWRETHGRGGDGGGMCGGDDFEPSLSLTNDIDQALALRNSTGALRIPGTQSWHGHDQDLEADHDGSEPDADFEHPEEDEGADEHTGAEMGRGAL